MESMTLEKATARLFEDNFDCAQTVFSHFAEELDLDEETALKISCTRATCAAPSPAALWSLD